MIERLRKTLQEASDLIKEQAGSLGENARERTYQLMEDWLEIFPQLEIYGLEITSFALSMGISPALNVELRGAHQDFPPERLDQILEECRSNTALSSIFSTVKTTYKLHRRIYANLHNPLLVKVRIQIPPEIKVYIGEPIVE